MSLFKREKEEQELLQNDFKLIKEESVGGFFGKGRLVKHFSSKFMRGGKKFLLTVLTLLMLASSSSAHVRDLKSEVDAFIKQTKTTQMDLETAKEKFRKIMKNVDKELAEDLKDHNYHEAERLLSFYKRIAEILGDYKLAMNIESSLQDLGNDLVKQVKESGIFQFNGKIYVVGTTKRQMRTDAREQIIDALTRHKGNMGLVDISFRGVALIVGYEKTDSGYKYIVEIPEINSKEFTENFAHNLPKLPI